MSEYTEAVERGLAGMKGVSTGTCPSCATCMEIDECADAVEHRLKWSAVDCASGEAHFSWAPCGICGSELGGDRYVWHWIDGGDEHGKGGTIEHESDACVDCVLYLANGDEPESWSAR